MLGAAGQTPAGPFAQLQATKELSAKVELAIQPILRLLATQTTDTPRQGANGVKPPLDKVAPRKVATRKGRARSSPPTISPSDRSKMPLAAMDEITPTSAQNRKTKPRNGLGRNTVKAL